MYKAFNASEVASVDYLLDDAEDYVRMNGSSVLEQF